MANKFEATYTDGTSFSAPCNGDSSLTTDTTKNASATDYRLMSTAVIGDCVTSISSSVFAYCSNLTSVDIGSGVTSIDSNAFADCTSLTSVTIPNSVTSIGMGAFDHCSGLTSITIPSGVTSISTNVFYGCSSLESVTIPNSVTNIGYQAFYKCTGLTSITVNATTPPTLGSSGFKNTNDCPIYVPCGSVDAYKAASGWSYYADRIVGIPPCGEPTPPTPTGSTKFSATYTDGTSFSAPCDDDPSLTTATTQTALATDYRLMRTAVIGDCVATIGFGAFYYCKSLTSVTIPNSVTSIGDFAFNECKSLPSVAIPDSVTNINDSAFRDCTGLTSVTIGNSVTSIGESVFQKCSGLTSVTIPSSVTNIGSYALDECPNLTSVTVNATTPPTLGTYNVFDSTNNCPIYVPCGSVDAYKAASDWSSYASRIVGIPPCDTPTPDPIYRTTSSSTYCTRYDKYVDVYSQVSYDNGSTWQTTATTPTLVEPNSTDCGYIPLINKTCKYYKYQKYVSYDNGATWQPLDEYQRGGLMEYNSPDCGEGIGALYRWEVITSDYQCVGYDKYEKTQKYVSYDNGVTYAAVEPAEYGIGGLIQSNSEDCGYEPSIEYRWVDSGTTCQGYDKYNLQIKQQSTDEGVTWTDVIPTETQLGTLIEADSEDCGYEPSIEYRWVDSGTTCQGYDKYNLQIKQQSTDGGVTWTNVIPTETQLGTLIEADSEDCGGGHAGEDDYLTFIALEDGTFKFSKPVQDAMPFYSLDDGETWTYLPSSANTLTVTAGSKILWKGSLLPYKGIGRFEATGRFNIEGNILSLLFMDNFKNHIITNLYTWAFGGLFRECTTLISAEHLVLTGNGGYFYNSMFYGCTSLTTGPQILIRGKLASYCCAFMFSHCSSLKYIKCLATSFGGNATSLMTNGVAANGTFVQNRDANWKRGEDGIPNGWTVEYAS